MGIADLTGLEYATNLGGEMYLKAGVRIDINADVLDLILVSQGFDTTKGDINGDGMTNLLDLTLVARQFSQ